MDMVVGAGRVKTDKKEDIMSKEFHYCCNFCKRKVTNRTGKGLKFGKDGVISAVNVEKASDHICNTCHKGLYVHAKPEPKKE